VKLRCNTCGEGYTAAQPLHWVGMACDRGKCTGSLELVAGTDASLPRVRPSEVASTLDGFRNLLASDM
jgi:hypothetical protein